MVGVGQLDGLYAGFIINTIVGIFPPSNCEDALDANDDGQLDIADAIYVLNYLFIAGPAMPPPFPEPGLDPTADGLGCFNEN